MSVRPPRMDIVGCGPLRADALVWQPRAGTFVLTVVAKATFDLREGESTVAGVQEHLYEEDNHWDDDPNRSLQSAADLVPFKAHADVMLVGHAFAPKGEPVTSLQARLCVGDVDKVIEVCGDRWWTLEGELHFGAPFTKMPLRYERAAGGPDTWNPVGIRPDARPDARGNVQLPNLQPPTYSPSARGEPIEPVGFGPVAPTWPDRRTKLEKHAAPFRLSSLGERPLSQDFDRTAFNAAPPDQRIAALRPDERIILENLHPRSPRLVTSLPGVRLRAFADRPGDGPQEVAMNCDTLWIDTDRAVCTVTWRGQMLLAQRDQAGRVIVAAEAPSQQLTWADILALASERPRQEPPATLTGRGGRAVRSLAQTADIESAMGGALKETLPFVTSESFTPAPEAGAAPRRTGLPFAPQPGPTAAPAAWQARMGPPSPMTYPTPPPASAPPLSPPTPAPPPLSSATWHDVPPSSRSVSGSPSSRPPTTIGSLSSPAAPPMSNFSAAAGVAARGGAVAASNAAAESARSPTSVQSMDASVRQPPKSWDSRATERAVFELLWFDPKVIRRVQIWWKELIADLEFEPIDARHDLPCDAPEEVKDRNAASGVLARVEPQDGPGIARSVTDAIRADGQFTPPLAVVSGDLLFAFDEIQTLKVTVHAVTPMIGADKKLKDAVDAASEALNAPYLQDLPGLAEKLTRNLREQSSQSNKALTSGYLDAEVERVLLSKRAYQKRNVFGQTWIRAGFLQSGAEAVMPAYLPEPLAGTLPMVERMRVRLIVEVHAQQDRCESHTLALRVVALGRVLELGEWVRKGALT